MIKAGRESLTRVLVLALAFGLICAAKPPPGSNAIRPQGRQKVQRKTARYACPMHPEITSSRPGKCPKCGMTLRQIADPVETATTQPNSGAKEAADSFSFSSSRIPDTRVYDQNGKRLNFYSDLIKNKTVAINFIFTT